MDTNFEVHIKDAIEFTLYVTYGEFTPWIPRPKTGHFAQPQFQQEVIPYMDI